MQGPRLQGLKAAMGNGESSRKSKTHNGKDGKRKGNGNNGRPLKYSLRESMYRAFAVQESMAKVARICGVSETTVKKYRDLDRWDERLKRLRRKVADHEDKKIEVMLKRQVRDAQDIQALAMARILEGGFAAEDVALRAFDIGSRIERVAAGEAGDRIEGDLMGELARRHAERKRKEQEGEGDSD